MGYTFDQPIQSYPYGGYIDDDKHTLSTVATTLDLGGLLLYDWMINRVKYATLDIHIPYLENTAAAENSIDGTQYIQVQSAAAGTWTSAIAFSTGCIKVPASKSVYGITYKGYLDISAEVQVALQQIVKALTVRWYLSKTTQDNMIISCCQPVLNIVSY